MRAEASVKGFSRANDAQPHIKSQPTAVLNIEVTRTRDLCSARLNVINVEIVGGWDTLLE